MGTTAWHPLAAQYPVMRCEQTLWDRLADQSWSSCRRVSYLLNNKDVFMFRSGYFR